ncbi:unnamed protein product [Chondrus crispus]|uniref:Uncharacterized protein n=1 Tax=Chondrus crispus TaxID=2769 RepID=R7QLN3_CHOCR|nr:unnamed protein product [Chondrus crispus]CDF38386.1 unnamed protein product [Chondrus crispus]|eukprot:XP_005718279.1 unnamed protein product [Chondrus crispus]
MYSWKLCKWDRNIGKLSKGNKTSENNPHKPAFAAYPLSRCKAKRGRGARKYSLPGLEEAMQLQCGDRIVSKIKQHMAIEKSEVEVRESEWTQTSTWSRAKGQRDYSCMIKKKRS